MNLIECFAPSLKGRANQEALVFNDRSWTFGEIDLASDRVATALKNRYGIVRGDRISMYIGNCPELITFYLAAQKCGVIVVPMNVLYRDRELSHLVSDTAPRLVLTDLERYAVFAPLRASFPSIENIFVVDGNGADHTLTWQSLDDGVAVSPVDVSKISGDDPALMIYTSGTTGLSKGALLTHHGLVSNIVSLLHCWQWTDRDRFVLALPLFHMHGLGNGLHGWLASGCRMRLFERFKAEVILESLRSENGTLFFGVPTMYERFIEAVEKGTTLPPKMRLYVSGSAPLSTDTFVKFEKLFGQRILERYGMSETAMITSNLYCGEGARVQGTVGRALPGISVRIQHPEGRLVNDNEMGEIQVRGPNVLKEYWRQPEKTKEAFTADGWFKTGDIGRYDAARNIAITGRAKELIISGGFNIYPQEIINCLMEHPQVQEAAVIGVLDQRRGELVKAYVVCKDGVLSAETLMEYCGKHLASFKVPKSIEFLTALPRNAMGKLQLSALPNRDKL